MAKRYEFGPGEGTGFLGAIAMAATAWFLAIGEVLTGDRALNSFARQGIDELGAATKAFPDSIQVDEIGTIWNPTQAEINQSGKAHYREYTWRPGDYPTPGEIAASNEPRARDNDQGRDQEQDLGY